MNKALIPAFFLLGSIIVGVSIMVPQFANAQEGLKVNDQQLQALKLFFNVQNGNTDGNQEVEASDAQSSKVQSQQVQQEQSSESDDTSHPSHVQSQQVQQQQQQQPSQTNSDN